MMELEITQPLFERYVPAFRSPTGEVFGKMGAALGECIDRWGEQVKGDDALDEETERMVVRAVCLRAAYETIPQLDLVLTPTGFGIVSNQNTAPASRDRVQSLQERLRRSASRAEDACTERLLAAGRLAHPEVRMRSLLWSARLMRAYGVKTEQGGEVYEEERAGLQGELFAAELEVQALVSAELYGALVRMQWDGTDVDELHGTLTDDVRRVLACRMQRRERGGLHTELAMRSLLNNVQTHASELPEYAGSRTAEAQNMARYENGEDDACFFFG